MTLFAHIESGFAQDVLEDATPENYERRFSADILQGFVIVSVPDGTLPGAKANGDGTFTNPAPPIYPTPAPKPLALTKQQFVDLYAQNNADLTATLANWPTG